MLSQPPEHADPRRLCEQGKSFSGTVALRDFARLRPLLTSAEGEVAFALAFDRDTDKRLRIQGQVDVVLQVRCQRCMSDMALPVHTVFCLSPVSGPQEAESLPDHYDPLLLDGQLLRPLDLIEDELILTIPPAPRHPEDDCAVNMQRYRIEPVADKAGQARQDNPFAVLGGLKCDNDE